MADFEFDKDITSLTTFGIPVRTRIYAEYDSEKSLRRIMRSKEYLDNEVLHIGGGSNLLFINDFNGLILHSAIKGIKEYRTNQEKVYVIAGAGEKWDDLVSWCVKRGLGGLENLSGIPGEVGASAIQNIGAYGVEAGDRIHSVECLDRITGNIRCFTREECNFAYRHSYFKQEEVSRRYYVLRVSYRLDPCNKARHLEYGPLRSLSERLGHQPTLREVRDEIISIRDAKLPDPKVIGSAGSFFKNPVVSRKFYEKELLSIAPDIPVYPVSDDYVKVPAGWLIEQSGLKGYTIGGAEVYPRQCLVIANRGNASGDDVKRLADHIVRTVRNKFHIRLYPEVNYIDSRLRITLLGTGTSKGVPEIACDCDVCRSDDARDKRTRASVLVESGNSHILIDVSPDFRQQALANDITGIDAVLLTHIHYDHVGGIDDLRPVSAGNPMPVYMRQDVNEDLHRRLDYCFKEHIYPGVLRLEPLIIDDRPFKVGNLSITPIEVIHAKLPIVGFRIKNFAYITDCKTISETELEKLEGVDVLVLNALRFKEHFSHLNLNEALRLIDRIKPRKAYLTHFSHEIGLQKETEPTLPDNVFMAYDGLSFTI